MNACCCSLAGTAACAACRNRLVVDFFAYPEWPQVGRHTRRIIEEFDKDGNLIKRTTEN